MESGSHRLKALLVLKVSATRALRTLGGAGGARDGERQTQTRRIRQEQVRKQKLKVRGPVLQHAQALPCCSSAYGTEAEAE